MVQGGKGALFNCGFEGAGAPTRAALFVYRRASYRDHCSCIWSKYPGCASLATGDKSLALSLIFRLTENHGGFSVWPIHHSAVGWPPVRCTASYVFVQVPRSANRTFDPRFQGERNKQERAAVLERMARRVGQRFWMEPAHG